jgi:hypothetical protein
MSPFPCVALQFCSTEATKLLEQPYTLIARTNVELFKEVLELWEAKPSIKFHINGATTRQRFQTCLNEIDAAFLLYAASASADMQIACAEATQSLAASQPLAASAGGRVQYKKFFSWTALKRFAESQQDESDEETSTLLMTVSIIEMYRDQTLFKCNNFKRATLAEFRADEADVIVTTTHQAKGMEFDIVRLCDDFADLNVFEKNEIKFRVGTDDANLWCVLHAFIRCNSVTSCAGTLQSRVRVAPSSCPRSSCSSRKKSAKRSTSARRAQALTARPPTRRL